MKPRWKATGTGKGEPGNSLVLDRSHQRDADFSGRRLDQFAAIGCSFECCRFEGMSIGSASFGAGEAVTEYTECSFDGSKLFMGPGGYARFLRCSFRDVEVRNWFCFAVEVVDCVFTGRMQKSFFNGTVPPEDRRVVRRRRNEFFGNDFSSCNLVDVAFRTGIDLSSQRLPEEPDYLYLPEARSVVAHLRQLAESSDDRNVAVALAILELEAEGDQTQLLLRESDFAEYGPVVLGILRQYSGRP